MTEDKMNREWKFNANVAGISAPTGGNKNVTEGYYMAKLTDCYINPEKPNRVIFKMTISQGEFAGVVRTSGLNVPKDTNDNVRYYWRGLLESVGYGPDSLDNGELELGAGTFVGRDTHFYYAPKGHDGAQWDKLDFLSAVDFSQRKQAFDAKPVTTGTTLGGPSAPLGGAVTSLGGATNSLATSGVTSKDDVLAQLGITN